MVFYNFRKQFLYFTLKNLIKNCSKCVNQNEILIACFTIIHYLPYSVRVKAKGKISFRLSEKEEVEN